MGLAEGRRVPGERGDSAEQDSSFPAAEVRAALRAALSQTMEFSRLLRAPPPAQGPAEKRTHERTTPPPKGPAHSDPPVQPPSSCRVVFFFFGAKSLLVYFPELFGDSTRGVGQECGNRRA